VFDVLKRLLVGRPRRSARLGETLRPKRLALPVFCSDPISSVARGLRDGIDCAGAQRRRIGGVDTDPLGGVGRGDTADRRGSAATRGETLLRSFLSAAVTRDPEPMDGQPAGRRGKLRIYLGAAPGVGKTHAALSEARRRAERGTDVVVGFAETYHRPKTEALLTGLEIVPRRRMTYRGSEFTEMDLDAVLVRRPAVAVVDELAHTNVPSCRHAKRWEDIEELLVAGITVLSTLNIQHLESLHDAIERITGVAQRETVPDEVVRRARRIAARVGAELLVLHILRGDGLAGADPAALVRCRVLAEALGASFHTVVGDDIPTALLDFAHGVNATQLLLGTSRRHSRLARLFNEGIGATVVQRSRAIDVHLVTHEHAGTGTRLPALRSALPRWRKRLGWLAGVPLSVAATAIGVSGAGLFGLSTDVVVFLLAVVSVALIGGLGPALLAAMLSGLLLNYFLTPPLYTLTIADRANVITLVLMLLVAVLVAMVVDRATRRAEQAARARTEASLLASYARTVLIDPDPLPRLLDKIRENFALISVALLERHDGQWRLAASSGRDPCQGQGFTDAMGGTITAEDTPGGGLTLVISLPIAPKTREAIR
jgi:K+-sensing histidine kinase KdpD